MLIKSTAEGESRISEDLEFDTLLFWPFGSRKLTYIPKYAKYFDSFVAPRLKDKEFELQPFTVPVKDDRITVKLKRMLRRLRRKGGTWKKTSNSTSLTQHLPRRRIPVKGKSTKKFLRLFGT